MFNDKGHRGEDYRDPICIISRGQRWRRFLSSRRKRIGRKCTRSRSHCHHLHRKHWISMSLSVMLLLPGTTIHAFNGVSFHIHSKLYRIHSQGRIRYLSLLFLLCLSFFGFLLNICLKPFLGWVVVPEQPLHHPRPK